MMNSSEIAEKTYSNHKYTVNIIFTTLRVFSFLTSLVNTIVFLNPKLKNPIYKFLTMMSVSDMLYSFLVLSLSLMVYINYLGDPGCVTLICYYYNYSAFWINEYITTCLAMFSIVLECYLTLQRILVLSETRSPSLKRMLDSAWIGVILFITVVLIHSPLILVFQVKLVSYVKDDSRLLRAMLYSQRNITIGFDITKTQFGNSIWGSMLIKSLSSLRILLVTVVLFALNVCAVCRFKRFFHRKQSLVMSNRRISSQNRRSGVSSRDGKCVTKMLIILSFVYILGNLPHAIQYIYRIIDGKTIHSLFWLSQFTLNIMISIKLFIYYVFNPPYRDCFKLLLAYLYPSCLKSHKLIQVPDSEHLDEPVNK